MIAMSRRLVYAVELDRSPIEFPVYQMTSVIDGHHVSRTLTQQRRRVEVPKTEAEQDEAIRAAADTELEQLEAQHDDSSDSSDDDYRPIPPMAPQAHYREASGSSSSPPQQIDPALLAILDKMQRAQQS